MLERSGCADRRAELERGLAAINRARPTSLTPAEAEAEARAAGVGEVAARRIRHVVSGGGGFGGSIVAVAKAERAPSLVEAVSGAYVERRGRAPAGYVLRVPGRSGVELSKA